MIDTTEVEYRTLRDTIRERRTARLCAVLVGLVAGAALTIALLIAELRGSATLVPFLVLVGTYEISYFIHNGVERTAVTSRSSTKTRGRSWMGNDRYELRREVSLRTRSVFSIVFAAATSLNFFTLLLVDQRPGWNALSLLAHLAFAYRIVSAKKSAASQRALDLDRFRNLLSK